MFVYIPAMLWYNMDGFSHLQMHISRVKWSVLCTIVTAVHYLHFAIGSCSDLKCSVLITALYYILNVIECFSIIAIVGQNVFHCVY